MDFEQFNTRKRASEGVPVHFHAPYEPGELLYDDDDPEKPCRAWVRGYESREIEAYVQEMQRRAAERREEGEPVNLVEEGSKLAAALVIRFENINRADKPLTTSDSDLKWFFDLSRDFADQITKVAKDNKRFLGKTAEG